MPDDKPADIRKQVYGNIDAASITSANDAESRTRPSWAQQPGAGEDECRAPIRANAELKDLLKAAAESNIRHFIERLLVEPDREQRQTLRQLLLREKRWFALKQEWPEMIQRQLRDCDGRVLRHRAMFDREGAAGVVTSDVQMVLDNLLDIQRLLRESLHVELPIIFRPISGSP
jgi:hypothetical protein